MMDPEYYFKRLEEFELKELIRRPVWDTLKALRGLKVKDGIHGEVSESAVIKGPVHVGEGTRVHEYTVIMGPAYIGEGCEIGPFALIRPFTVIGKRVVIGHYAEVKRSVVMARAKVQSHTFVGDSVLGVGSRIGSGTILANRRFDQGEVKVKVGGEEHATGLDFFGAIIGDFVRLGANCVTAPGTLIGPYSWIYPGTFVRGFLPQCSLVKKRDNLEIIKKEPMELKD